jgi:subtilisin family serine protease
MPVPQALKLAIEDVSHHGHADGGALVVFAAGNNNRELMPGELYSIPEVVTVGAINNFDEAAPYSNHGAEVDLTAPTGSLTLDLQGDAGAGPGDTTSLFGGTSSACPVVAGVAALMFSKHPGITADEVRRALIASARAAPYAQPDVTGHDPLYGYGIVNPGAALQMLEPLPTPPDVEIPAVTESLGKKACGCASSPLTALAWLGFLVGTRRKRS